MVHLILSGLLATLSGCGHTIDTTLAITYVNGQGMPQSSAETLTWYRKAAEQGNVMGQVNLGQMYANGQGVPQSDSEAVAWYRKAAEQGHAAAQRGLGWMYANGRGIPQDAVKAHMWESLALSNGEAKAGALLDEVAKQLTPSQITQAQALAHACRASNYKACE